MGTIADNQAIALKEKIKIFFANTIKQKESTFCPIKDMLAASLDKWSLFVIYNLGYHKLMRFNALKFRIDGISSRMLSITLKKLEKNGLVDRFVYAEVPPRVEYKLTDFGSAFADKLIDMSQWYVEHYQDRTQSD